MAQSYEIIRCSMSQHLDAMRIADVLQGQTYLNLDVTIAPHMGELSVSVHTMHEDCTPQELTEMATALLAQAIMRG